jgi:hypothetical protein
MPGTIIGYMNPLKALGKVCRFFACLVQQTVKQTGLVLIGGLSPWARDGGSWIMTNAVRFMERHRWMT